MHSDKNDENYIYYVIGQNLKKLKFDTCKKLKSPNPFNFKGK